MPEHLPLGVWAGPHLEVFNQAKGQPGVVLDHRDAGASIMMLEHHVMMLEHHDAGAS